MSDIVQAGQEMDSLKELVQHGPFLFEQVPNEPSGCNQLCKEGINALVKKGLAVMIVVKNKPTFVAATADAMAHIPL